MFTKNEQNIRYLTPQTTTREFVDYEHDEIRMSLC
jgi:hypothetical protein